MKCPVVAVRGENETRVQIKVVAHCTSAVKGGSHNAPNDGRPVRK